MTQVLVTGANGFVGSTLCPMLAAAGYAVRAALRTGTTAPAGVAECVTIGAIGGATDWNEALQGVELVIHLAARAHAVDVGPRCDELYAETNSNGTRLLAAEAARHGVRRFVYLSSVKVNGEENSVPYSVRDPPQPQDAYGRSKWLAEQCLWETASTAPMQVAVVRAPLVYGPGVRANFLRLLSWVDRGRPLPFGAVHNRRSLVSGWTLCDLLIRLLAHPRAVNRTWMVSDGDDVSTAELVGRIASAMGRRARLWAIPPPLLRAAGGLLGRGAEMRRLCGSLTVDIGPTLALLEWSPPLSMDEALVRTASWYTQQRGRSG
ncbi:MAG TPA: NAD-dependent epimerase/dehydratase family protein [Steroidobacteraceae bacterium]|jgi:nucleoside-diphosphate-sugar epimerase|nr:NAD-dependent epimerase/dehydratase family protein [Steroidobacteraceae bacterium]